MSMVIKFDHTMVAWKCFGLIWNVWRCLEHRYIQMDANGFLMIFGQAQVKFTLSEETLATFQLAATAGTAFEVKPSGKPKFVQTSYLTEDDFKSTITGQKNMSLAVQALQADFEKIHYPLCSEAGTVELPSVDGSKEKTVVSWAQLLARIPGYFAHRKKTVKDKGVTSLGDGVGLPRFKYGTISIDCR